MILTDGKRTVRIEMRVWTGSNLLPDIAEEFFDAGLLMRNSVTGAYYVDDVGYCIEQANDWSKFQGDFYYDKELSQQEERVVFVDEEVAHVPYL